MKPIIPSFFLEKCDYLKVFEAAYFVAYFGALALAHTTRLCVCVCVFCM